LHPAPLRNIASPFSFTSAMPEDQDIASYEVSEDGVTWRPFDAARDQNGPLHKRIVFAQQGAYPEIALDGLAPA